MKKVLILALSLFVCMAGVSGATDWSVVRSAGNFYIGSDSGAILYFYGEAGESYVFLNLNESIKLACGIAPISVGKIEKYGYDMIEYASKNNDLYLIACLKASGLSGNTTIGVLDASFFSQREAAQQQQTLSDEEKVELQKRMDEALGKK